MARKNKIAVPVCFHYIQTIRDFHTLQRTFSPIHHAVSVGIRENYALMLCGSRQSNSESHKRKD